MANIVVVGAQWGDEGKGKVIDILTKDFDYVVRYQGVVYRQLMHVVRYQGVVYHQPTHVVKYRGVRHQGVVYHQLMR